MKQFYKIKNDLMFKAIFCKEENKDILERLIEEVIERPVNIIKLDVEVAKKNINEKGRTLDVLVKSDGYLINIEINTYTGDYLNRRNASYIFAKYNELVHRGESYMDMPKVIQINLSTLSKKEPIMSKYELYDKVNNKTYINNLEIYELNISKIKETCYNKPSKYQVISMLDCTEEELDKIKGDEMMERVAKEAKYLNEDTEFVRWCSDEEEARLFNNTIKAMAKLEGHNEGKREGKIEGKREGIKEGILTVTKNMLEKGMNIEDICEITGLTKEEINNLK